MFLTSVSLIDLLDVCVEGVVVSVSAAVVSSLKKGMENQFPVGTSLLKKYAIFKEK